MAQSKVSAESSKPGPKKRTLTVDQIALMRGLWEQGAQSIKEIAAEVGCTYEQAKYKINKAGWVQGCRAEYYEEIARKAIEAELAKEAQELAEKKEGARNKAVQIANIIEGRMIKQFQDADSSSLSNAAIANDLKALEIASRINQNTFHTKRFALGMDKEESAIDDMAGTIEVLEMTADEVEEIRQQQEEDYAANGIEE